MSLLHLGERQDDVQTACRVYYPGIGADGVTGTSYVAYMSLIPGAEGVWVRPLSKTGVTGKAFRLPGSVTRGNVFSWSQRMAITGRGHGRAGVYVSYGAGWPEPTALEVYRLGASKPFPIAKFTEFGPELANSTITTGPDGKLWDVWVDGAGGPAQALFVRASNPAATAWSPIAGVPLPRGTSNIWRAYASAQLHKVDVVALITVNGRTAFYATRVPFPVPPKKTAPQSWRIAKTVTSAPKNGSFTAMVATGKTTAWAFDSSGNSTAEPAAWVLRGGTWGEAPFRR